MADDALSAPAATDDGSATAPGTAAAPATDGAAETTEQRFARLERERDEAIAAGKRERDLRLSHQEKVERANQIIAEQDRRGASLPTGAGTGNPLDEAIARGHHNINALAAEQAELQRAGKSDPLVDAALDQARISTALLMERKHGQNLQAAYNQCKPLFDADPKLGPRAEQIWVARGGALSAQEALDLALAESINNERSRTKAGDAAAAERLARVPSTATGGGPAASSAPANGTMPFTEYLQKLNGGGKAARDLAAAVASGSIRLDRSR